MAVEFVVDEFKVQTSTRGGYRNFIQNLRVRLGVRSSHNRPALAVQEEPPTRFFELILRTNDHSVRFRLRMDNLYLIGYQMEGGQWLEFDNDSRTHLIQNSTFLRFGGSYGNLASSANQRVEETRVGFYNFGHAINQLATSTSGEARARSLIVVIMMICESVRLIPVSNYMADNFDNSHGTSSMDYNATNRNREGLIKDWIMSLVRCWDPFSAALLRADAYPDESFQLGTNVVRLPPDNREIRTIAQVVEIIGILLGHCFKPRERQRFQR